MRYNTLKELTDVINILWEIEDVALSNCGSEGEQAIRAAIESVQKAWNVCKRGMESKGMDTSVYSSRRAIKSSADNLPSEVYYIVVNGSRQYYEDYDEADDNLETLRAIGKGKVDGVYTETDPDEIYELYEVGYIGNSRKPVKSSRKPIKSSVQVIDDGKYVKVISDTGKEYEIGFLESYNTSYDIGVIFDWNTEVPTLVDWFFGIDDITPEKVGPYIDEYERGQAKEVWNSHRPIKSSAAPDGLSFVNKDDSELFKGNTLVEYKVIDENVLDKLKEVCEHNEDELQLGNVFIQLMYDDSNTLVDAMVVDTESSSWDLSSEECVEVFGSSIETLSDPSVDNQSVTSSRKSKKSVKSGLDFVQKGEVILAKKGTKVVGYIGQNANKEFYYGLGTPGKSSGVMVVSDFNSAAKRLEEQSRQ